MKFIFDSLGPEKSRSWTLVLKRHEIILSSGPENPKSSMK